MLTKADYISLMEHAIGGSTPATGHTLERTLERAGRYLFNKYPWPWLQKGPTTLAAVSGDPDIDLPTDFGSVLSIMIPNNITLMIEWSTPDEVHRRRRLPLIGLTYYVALSAFDPQASTTTAATPKLMLDRTPSSNGDPTFEIFYNRRFVIPSADVDVPNMPAEMEDCLVKLARSFAWALENDDEHPDMARAEAAMKEAWRFYGRTQPILGRVRGGAGDRVGRWTGRRGFNPGQIVF